MNKEKALKIFNLSPTFTEQELKQVWRQLVKKHHPDISGNAESFKKVKKAYDFLTDYRQRYPKETDWEDLFTTEFKDNYTPAYEFTSFDNYAKSSFEMNFMYVALMLIVMAILYILIINTTNTFLKGIWYSISIGLSSVKLPVSISLKTLFASLFLT